MSAALEMEKVSGGRQQRRKEDLWTERDGPLLRLAGEQYAVSVEQLARVIGRSNLRWLRDRRQRAGWVESRPLTPGAAHYFTTRQLEGDGFTGLGSTRVEHEYRVDPNDVRRLHAGQCFAIGSGLAMKLQIAAAQATTASLSAGPPAQVRETVPTPGEEGGQAGEWLSPVSGAVGLDDLDHAARLTAPRKVAPPHS